PVHALTKMFFFSSRRRHTMFSRDWSSDVCSSDLGEPGQLPIREESATVPTNPYGETKLAVENMFRWCDRAYGLKSISLRYFNAAGAHPDGTIGEDHDPETHLIPIVMQAALGQREKVHIFGDDYPTEDGTCIRDYIHVTDLANAHW